MTTTTTATPPTEQQETTPPAGQAGSTQPQAENTGTTPPQADNQPDIDAIIKKRLDRERKKWEQELTEREKRARMDESERLKAELADKDKLIAEAQSLARRERGIRALTEHTEDPEGAYILAEALGLIDDDGSVDRKKLLDKKPYLAKNTRASAPAATGEPPSGKALTPDDFRGKDPDWVMRNLPRLKNT